MSRSSRREFVAPLPADQRIARPDLPVAKPLLSYADVEREIQCGMHREMCCLSVMLNKYWDWRLEFGVEGARQLLDLACQCETDSGHKPPANPTTTDVISIVTRDSGTASALQQTVSLLKAEGTPNQDPDPQGLVKAMALPDPKEIAWVDDQNTRDQMYEEAKKKYPKLPTAWPPMFYLDAWKLGSGGPTPPWKRSGPIGGVVELAEFLNLTGTEYAQGVAAAVWAQMMSLGRRSEPITPLVRIPGTDITTHKDLSTRIMVTGVNAEPASTTELLRDPGLGAYLAMLGVTTGEQLLDVHADGSNTYRALFWTIANRRADLLHCFTLGPTGHWLGRSTMSRKAYHDDHPFGKNNVAQGQPFFDTWEELEQMLFFKAPVAKQRAFMFDNLEAAILSDLVYQIDKGGWTSATGDHLIDVMNKVGKLNKWDMPGMTAALTQGIPAPYDINVVQDYASSFGDMLLLWPYAIISFRQHEYGIKTPWAGDMKKFDWFNITEYENLKAVAPMVGLIGAGLSMVVGAAGPLIGAAAGGVAGALGKELTEAGTKIGDAIGIQRLTTLLAGYATSAWAAICQASPVIMAGLQNMSVLTNTVGRFMPPGAFKFDLNIAKYQDVTKLITGIAKEQETKVANELKKYKF